MGNKELTFDDFRKLASDNKLSKYEKIGFPDSYREGHESAMCQDILSKLPLTKTSGKVFLDIGSGCSDLVFLLIEQCTKNNHTIILIDSEEMLSHIPDSNNVIKIPGYFPEIPSLFNNYLGKVDYILTYSVFHYIFNEGNIYNFIHRAIDLLKPNGQFLIGDIPNHSKRTRFLNSEEGKKFLSQISQTSLKGATNHDDISSKTDDSIVLSILSRFRNYQCETYLLPQADSLPMANRREDILIVKR